MSTGRRHLRVPRVDNTYGEHATGEVMNDCPRLRALIGVVRSIIGVAQLLFKLYGTKGDIISHP